MHHLTTIRGLLFFLLSVCLLLPSHAISSAKGPATIKVQVVFDREEVIAGDSVGVSLLIYSPLPLARVVDIGELKASIKCEVRRLADHRVMTQRIIRLDGKPCYRTIVARYMVTPESAGDVHISPVTVRATMLEQTTDPDMLSRMMGVRPMYREVEAKGKSKKCSYTVIKKPSQSTLEMLRGGKTVI